MGEAAGQHPQMAKISLERAMDYLAVLQSEQARAMAAEAARIQSKLAQQAADVQSDRERTPASIRRTRSSTASLDDSDQLASETTVVNIVQRDEPYLVAEAEIVQNASCSLFSFFFRGRAS